MARSGLKLAGLVIGIGVQLAAVPAMAAGALVSAPIRSTYIYITHRDSQDFAAGVGMSRCISRYGSGCRVVKTFEAGCLAIAQSADGSHHSGWAVRASTREANLVAVGECAKTGASCHLDVSVCD